MLPIMYLLPTGIIKPCDFSPQPLEKPSPVSQLQPSEGPQGLGLQAWLHLERSTRSSCPLPEPCSSHPRIPHSLPLLLSLAEMSLGSSAQFSLQHFMNSCGHDTCIQLWHVTNPRAGSAPQGLLLVLSHLTSNCDEGSFKNV